MTLLIVFFTSVLVFMVSFCGYQVVKTKTEKEISFSTSSTEVTVIGRTLLMTGPRIYIIKYVDEAG